MIMEALKGSVKALEVKAPEAAAAPPPENAAGATAEPART